MFLAISYQSCWANLGTQIGYHLGFYLATLCPYQIPLHFFAKRNVVEENYLLVVVNCGKQARLLFNFNLHFCCKSLFENNEVGPFKEHLAQVRKDNFIRVLFKPRLKRALKCQKLYD